MKTHSLFCPYVRGGGPLGLTSDVDKTGLVDTCHWCDDGRKVGDADWLPRIGDSSGQ